MTKLRILPLLLLPLIITACSSLPTPQMPAKNQAYLNAQKEITHLPSHQYRYLQDKSIYIAESENQGRIISPDGSFYQGSIQDNKPHGFGKSTMITGEIYEGEHQNGRFEGKGKLILSDQSYFIGSFKNHKVHQGTMYFTDGKISELK
ncbi:hypothetical protein [Ignatzschineria sp. LJL83]